MSLSYEKSGVRYDQLDAFKRACQHAAKGTAGALRNHGYAEPASTRGESAYLIEAADHYLAHVEEGLGTKNLIEAPEKTFKTTMLLRLTIGMACGHTVYPSLPVARPVQVRLVTRPFPPRRPTR